jgi:DnaJ-class molecular chaperone
MFLANFLRDTSSAFPEKKDELLEVANRVCTACGGYGAVACSRCGGQGRLRQRKRVDVRVPAGAAEGTQVTVGESFFRVRTKEHPRFKRAGPDLLTTVNIPLHSALCGGEVRVQLLDRSMATVKLPPEKIVRPKDLLCVPGKGLPCHSREGHGDLFAEVTVEIPETLDPKAREAIHQALKPSDWSSFYGKFRRGTPIDSYVAPDDVRQKLEERLRRQRRQSSEETTECRQQ